MKRYTLFAYLAILPCLFFGSAYARHRITIDRAGDIFISSYKLHNSSDPSKPDLTIKVTAERKTVILMSAVESTMWPGEMHLRVESVTKGTPRTVEAWEKGKRGRILWITNTHNMRRSPWYPAVIKVLKRARQHFINDPKVVIQGRKPSKKKSASIHIAPLSDGQLITSFGLSRSLRVPLFWRVIRVDISSQYERLEKYGNQKMLTAIATFDNSKKIGTRIPARIKFVKTKDGIKEIERTNVSRDSLWHPWIEKVVQESLVKYNKYNKQHLVRFSC